MRRMKKQRMCHKCHIDKPLTDYGPNPKQRLGRKTICRACEGVVKRERRLADLEKARAMDKRSNDKRPRKRVIANPTATRDEAIYAAGLIDGEGTVTVHLTAPSALHLRIALSNSYHPVIIWLQERFGGRVYNVAPRNMKHKPLLQWYVGGHAVVPVLEAVLPYLRIKRRQAEIVLALAKMPRAYLPNKSGRKVPAVTDEVRAAREPLIAEIVDLNHRGVA